MSYQVRITETAKQDLREIAFYIAGHSMDNDIAKRFIMELRDQCNCTSQQKLDTRTGKIGHES